LPIHSTATRTPPIHTLSLHDALPIYRQQWEDRAIEGYKLYIGYRKEFEETTEGKRRRIQRSNIHVPRPYELADSLRARIVKSFLDRKSTRLNSSHVKISYAVFCLKKK